MSRQPNTEFMRQAIITAIRNGEWPGAPGGMGVQEYQVRSLDDNDVAGLYHDMLERRQARNGE